MRNAARWTALVLSLARPAMAGGQEAPLVRKVFSSTEELIGGSLISPNGKWLLYTKELNVAPGNTELRILALPKGEPRRLLEASDYKAPQLTPDGKRLLLVSTALNRSAADQKMYVVAAPFDVETGTLTGPLRQITLDAIQVLPRHNPRISPDGAWLAYVECCSTGALRIIPIAGGNPRTLYTPKSTHPRATPFSMGWTPDGRAVLFQVEEAGAFTRMRVNAEGGTPVVLGRAEMPISRPLEDGKTWVLYESGIDRQHSTIRFITGDGTPIGSPVELPFGSGAAGINPFGSSKTFLVRVGDGLAPLTVAPVGGGASREITPATEYHWMTGWSGDGRTVYSGGWSPIDSLGADLVAHDLDGRLVKRWSPPDGMRFTGATPDGHGVLRTVPTSGRTDAFFSAMSLSDGKVQPLGEGKAYGSATTGAGGAYGLDGNRVLLAQVVGNRVQIRSVGTGGDSRVVFEGPASPLARHPFSVHGDRVAFTEEKGDSTLLRLSIGPKVSPRTIATFPHKNSRPEIAWSHDGTMLAMTVGPSSVWFLPVGRDGSTGPLPPAARLPFSYYYEPRWLPDGSGITVIAQPNGSPGMHVALIRLSDPERPVILTRDDSHDKWGHLVSPDGKYVVYPSERYQGNTLWAVDLDEALRLAKRK